MQYLSGLFGVIAIIVLIIIWPIITRKPTCFDGKRNGDERGVDCGGICQKICTADTTEPVILWYRAFPVTGNVYNLVAFVENRNKEAAVMQVNYEFKIYDTRNILIGRREGKTFIPANQQFAVFEPRFDAGASEVRSVSFDFTSPFVWYKKPPTIQTLPIQIDNIIFDEGSKDTTPTLTARARNDSIYDLPEFDVIAILYDQNHNAINASKTHKDGLPSNEFSPLLFTWPQTLSSTPATKDLILMVNPFTTPF